MPDEFAGVPSLMLSGALAVVLLVALYSKLSTWEQTRRWLRDVGLAYPSLVLALGLLSEGALAALLLASPRWGGAGVALWLVPVTALLHRSNRLELDCGCLGARSGRTSRRLPYLRNACLFLAAVVLAANPAASVPLSLPLRLGLALAGATLILAYLLGRPDPTRFDTLPATPPSPEDLKMTVRASFESW